MQRLIIINLHEIGHYYPKSLPLALLSKEKLHQSQIGYVNQNLQHILYSIIFLINEC